MSWFGVDFATLQGEPKENNAADDNDRKDDSHESDDKVLSLEHGDVAAEVPAQRVDQSMNKVSKNLPYKTIYPSKAQWLPLAKSKSCQ